MSEPNVINLGLTIEDICAIVGLTKEEAKYHLKLLIAAGLVSAVEVKFKEKK